MKILYHHRTLGDGAEGIHVAEMIKAFRTLGHEVRVISLIGEQTNTGSQSQRSWSRVSRLLPGAFYELGELAYNVPGFAQVTQAIRSWRPDFIYDRYVSYNYSAVWAGKRLGIPVVLEVNSPYSLQKQTFDERLYFPKLCRWCERSICRTASRVLTVSTPLKHVLMSIGVPKDQIVVMPNGVDPDRFHPLIGDAEIRRQYGLEKKLVVGFTGILRPWHGPELLAEAFHRIAQRHADLHLLIVGDGPSRASLEQWFADRGLSTRLTVTGRVPHDAVRRLVAAMDIAVSPRATFYSSPMKILEYMAMGKPIVAPDMENIRDLLTHNKDGILFQPEDAASLTEALGRATDDASLRCRLGTNARKEIERHRTWLDNARRVIDLVQEAPGALKSEVATRRLRTVG
jgi:glycosyltransferase involved in cell wall biosynthesis